MDSKTENGEETPQSGVESDILVVQEEPSRKGQRATRANIADDEGALQLLRCDREQPIAEEISPGGDPYLAKMAESAQQRKVNAMEAIQSLT